MAQTADGEINEIIKYLFDDLSEDEMEKMEERIFLEKGFAEKVQTVKAKITDAYILNRLSDELRREFEEKFLIDPDNRSEIGKIKMLREELHNAEIHTKVAEISGTTKKPGLGRFPAWGYGLALLLIGFLIGASVLLSTRKQPEIIVSNINKDISNLDSPKIKDDQAAVSNVDKNPPENPPINQSPTPVKESVPKTVPENPPKSYPASITLILFSSDVTKGKTKKNKPISAGKDTLINLTLDIGTTSLDSVLKVTINPGTDRETVFENLKPDSTREGQSFLPLKIKGSRLKTGLNYIQVVDQYGASTNYELENKK